ncbi:MAG: Hint domain-containing protein [Rhodobacter sp.]|nr:Hint domain-containing protein [Rhodobacter sp.]
MVQRSFAAFDNEAFTVDPSSPSGTPGDPIINNSNTPVGQIFTFLAGFPYQTITLEDTSSTPDRFNDDDPNNHVIVNGSGLVASGTRVESESYHYVRQLDDNGDPFGPRITITVFSRDGVTQRIWGMASDTELVPGASYVKVGGSNNGTSLYNDFVPCFTAGTRIATARGELPVESLREGDRVITRDNGIREIRWVGHNTLDVAALDRDPSKRPVRIQANAFGPGRPVRDLYFSPNHRILLTEPGTLLWYGESEVLAAAKDLVGRSGVAAAPVSRVTYVHILFDRHEAVLSEGMWSESFLPGVVAMNGLEAAQRREILHLFPEIDAKAGAAFTPARRILRHYEARVPA